MLGDDVGVGVDAGTGSGQVALDSFDVAAAGLAEAGGPWDDVRAAAVLDRVGTEVAARLPVSGWRELSVARPGEAPSRVFAAPTGGGWAMAVVSDNGILSADPGPITVRPSRADRRRGLVLGLAIGDTCARDELGQVQAYLTNRGETAWSAHADDSGYVHGWLVPDGEDRTATFVAYTPLRVCLSDLAPGQSLTLPVDFDATAAELAPGRYTITAALVELDLWAAPRTVTLG